MLAIMEPIEVQIIKLSIDRWIYLLCALRNMYWEFPKNYYFLQGL